MTMLEPKLTMLDEIDSGLDVDAVRIVSEAVNEYHNEDNSLLIITHHSEILQNCIPMWCTSSLLVRLSRAVMLPHP